MLESELIPGWLFNTHTHTQKLTPQSCSQKSFIDVHRCETLITVYQAGSDDRLIQREKGVERERRGREREKSGRVIDDASAAVKMTNFGG